MQASLPQYAPSRPDVCPVSGEARLPAVIMVVSEHPQPASGGALGLCFKLLAALCDSKGLENAVLYCLTVADPKCYRIRRVEDLSSFSQPLHREMSMVSRLRDAALSAERGRYRIQRNGIQLLRAAIERQQISRLRPLLDSLMEEHSAVVFHAHTATVACKIVQALGESRGARRWRLLITDHSKGGALSEYVQSLGPSAMHDWNYRLVSRQTKVAVDAADVMAFPSRGARELWLDRNPDMAAAILSKTSILYNGVVQPETANCNSSDKKSAKLFAVAQHVPEKGLDRLLAAIAEIPKFLPGKQTSLRIAGGFTRVTPALETIRARLGLENQVTFLGKVDHATVLRELAAADIFVAFPRVVVFDLSLLEAMAMGKPVVSNPLNGNIEALGKTYPLFAGDETEFALKVARCANDGALRELVTRRNKRRYERLFTSAAMAQRHCDLYLGLIREVLALQV